MAFLLDECVPRRSMALLPALGMEVKDLKDEFGDQSRLDRDWVPAAASRGWVVLTYDRRIATRPDERRAYTEAGAVVIVLYASQTWNIRQRLGWLLLHWGDVEAAAGSLKRGTCARMSSEGVFTLCKPPAPGMTRKRDSHP